MAYRYEGLRRTDFEQDLIALSPDGAVEPQVLRYPLAAIEQLEIREQYGSGFRYAYQVPGMSRVVQAAGRVIRTPEDKGAIVLIGRRFLQRQYQTFFPDDWEPERSLTPAQALEGLWGPEDPVTETSSGR